ALGLTLPDFLAVRAAAAQPGRERAVILLWLWGGPSHLDTFDPKPEAPSEYRGPFKAIPTRADGIQVTELFPELARRADRWSLVRSLYHGTNDHGQAGTVNLTGRMPQPGRVGPATGS